MTNSSSSLISTSPHQYRTDIESGSGGKGSDAAFINCFVPPFLAAVFAMPATLFTYACASSNAQVMGIDPCIPAVMLWAASMLSLCCCAVIFICRSCD